MNIPKNKIRVLSGIATALVWSLVVIGNTNSAAQRIEPSDIVSPIVDSDPFDLLYLKEDSITLKILPLKEPPEKPYPERGELIFEFFDESEGQLQVAWRNVLDYKSFYSLLMDEADVWMRKKMYGPALRNYLYIYDHGGKNDPEVVQKLRKCVFEDGTERFESGDFEMALSIFEDIYRQDPSYQPPGISQNLIDIIMICYDGTIQRQFDKSEYSAVRKSLEQLTQEYPDQAKELEQRWSKKFSDRADELLDQAKDFADAGKGREAHLAARQAEQITPGREEVLSLKDKLLEQFPLILVGVSQPAADADPHRIEYWGSRRVGRMTQRSMVELTGITDEGGQYSFLNGEVRRYDQQGYEYLFRIDPGLAVYGAPPVTAFDVASQLLTMCDPQADIYSPSWAKIIDSVSIQDDARVMVMLRRAFVRPESLIEVPYRSDSTSPPEASDAEASGEKPEPSQNGKYILADQENTFSKFKLNPSINPIPDQQHPVVIEQLFPSASDAVDALLKNEIDVVDRIPVADLSRIRREPDLQARAYVIPTIHVLIPRIRGELAENLDFRRGLSHAINRDGMVRDVICGGKEVAGCESISGPFPIGTEDNDQISYGYDFKVPTPAYNDRLGMVLVQMALRPTAKRMEPLPVPNLVLAHPDSTIAANACLKIAQDWGKAGVPTTLRALNAGESIPPDDEWDVLYVELSMEEPMADITTLLGATGFAKDVSAPIEQTLRDLGYSQTWQSACRTLRQLHRQVSVDLSVIPLFQVKEYFAFRSTVREIGRDLIHLYENIERWRINFHFDDEAE